MCIGRTLFPQNSKVVSSRGVIGLSGNGQTLDIDDFVDNMQDKTTSAAFSHLTEDSMGKVSKMAEVSSISCDEFPCCVELGQYH